LAASARSAGKTYGELMETRWQLEDATCPDNLKNITVLDASPSMMRPGRPFCGVNAIITGYDVSTGSVVINPA
jgi:hypothetical protein